MTKLIFATVVGFLSINVAMAENAPLVQIDTWNDLQCSYGLTPTIRLIARKRHIMVTCEKLSKKLINQMVRQ